MHKKKGKKQTKQKIRTGKRPTANQYKRNERERKEQKRKRKKEEERRRIEKEEKEEKERERERVPQCPNQHWWYPWHGRHRDWR